MRVLISGNTVRTRTCHENGPLSPSILNSSMAMLGSNRRLQAWGNIFICHISGWADVPRISCAPWISSWLRVYIYSPHFAHGLGYIHLPYKRLDPCTQDIIGLQMPSLLCHRLTSWSHDHKHLQWHFGTGSPLVTQLSCWLVGATGHSLGIMSWTLSCHVPIHSSLAQWAGYICK
jgi:hypothetical protein